MKKIMFNDAYLLTQAVLNGAKTMTRRKLTLTLDKDVEGELIRVYPSNVYFDNGKWLFDFEGRTYLLPKENYPRYKVGEVVAIAQRYKDLYSYDDAKVKYNPFFDMIESAGWNNKLFVESQYMKHHIRITDVKIERLQNIREVECLCEGIEKRQKGYEIIYTLPNFHIEYYTPRQAFASLINKVSGNGTWESNPWVVVYTFELVD